MTDPAVRFHQEWLVLIQPSEGLVVSIPVLVDAQCMARQTPAVQQKLLDLCPVIDPDTEERAIRDLGELLAEMLGLTPDLFDAGEALPEDLHLYVPEGHPPLRRLGPPPRPLPRRPPGCPPWRPAPAAAHSCHDPRIEELRQLHEEVDRAVLAAYGWEDIPVPPYGTPTTDAERRALEAFEDEVIDRLFVLNAQRAEEEKRQALANPAKAVPKKGRGRRPKDQNQGFLLD